MENNFCAKKFNGLALAYLGDAYFELIVRKYLLAKGLTKVNELHKKATKYCGSINQAFFLDYLLEKELLAEEEISYYKKGRNAKPNHSRKNLTNEIQHKATGFEAIIGYLYIEGKNERIDEIFKIIIEIVECEENHEHK